MNHWSVGFLPGPRCSSGVTTSIPGRMEIFGEFSTEGASVATLDSGLLVQHTGVTTQGHVLLKVCNLLLFSLEPGFCFLAG